MSHRVGPGERRSALFLKYAAVNSLSLLLAFMVRDTFMKISDAVKPSHGSKQDNILLSVVFTVLLIVIVVVVAMEFGDETHFSANKGIH